MIQGRFFIVIHFVRNEEKHEKNAKILAQLGHVECIVVYDISKFSLFILDGIYAGENVVIGYSILRIGTNGTNNCNTLAFYDVWLCVENVTQILIFIVGLLGILISWIQVLNNSLLLVSMVAIYKFFLLDDTV